MNLMDRLKPGFLAFAAAVMVILLLSRYAGLPIREDFQPVIALSAYVMIAWEVVYEAFKTLIKRRRMNEQFLMTIATFGAFAMQDYPEALAVMIFYEIGERFEKYAAGKSHSAISEIVKLKPVKARVVAADGNLSEVKPRSVKIGQTIRVFAGEGVALDGYLLNESAALDTSALTGESAPKLYLRGEEVPSGCVNTQAVIDLKVSRDYRNSSITRLLNLIEDAAANKSRPEALISRFAVWYTPVVVACACILALVPLFLPGAQWQDWVTRALVFLVVSCPCALVLSVPLSFFGGLGAISKVGVMVKGSIHIENLAKLKVLAFDKTGTLTCGRFKVSAVSDAAGHNLALDSKEARSLIETAASLEQNSSHPLGQAVTACAKESGLALRQVKDLEEKAGLGIAGTLEGKEVRVGRAEFVTDSLPSDFLKDSAGTLIHISADGIYLGALELADEPKPMAAAALKELKACGVETALITGDRGVTARKVAGELGISKVFARQLPEDKLNNLKALRAGNTVTGFAGDGINDAPVLAAADVGIAMGQFGTAAAVEAADVVVMNDDLTKIPRAIRLARKTFNLAIQNIVFACGAKGLILILGALGYANIWLAIFGDVGVLVLAVLNAMRTLTFVKKGEQEKFTDGAVRTASS